MNREDYIKHLISEKGFNIKSFAAEIGMPYSTLLTMLNGSIGGASVDNVIKICKGLNITISDLQNYADAERSDADSIRLSEHEIRLIRAYRQNTAMQSAVDKLLNVADDVADDTCGDIAEDMARTLNISISQKTNSSVK